MPCDWSFIIFVTTSSESDSLHPSLRRFFNSMNRSRIGHNDVECGKGVMREWISLLAQGQQQQQLEPSITLIIQGVYVCLFVLSLTVIQSYESSSWSELGALPNCASAAVAPTLCFLGWSTCEARKPSSCSFAPVSFLFERARSLCALHFCFPLAIADSKWPDRHPFSWVRQLATCYEPSRFSVVVTPTASS